MATKKKTAKKRTAARKTVSKKETTPVQQVMGVLEEIQDIGEALLREFVARFDQLSTRVSATIGGATQRPPVARKKVKTATKKKTAKKKPASKKKAAKKRSTKKATAARKKKTAKKRAAR